MGLPWNQTSAEGLGKNYCQVGCKLFECSIRESRVGKLYGAPNVKGGTAIAQ